MTVSPVIHDYPDYGRQVSNTDLLVLDTGVLNLGAQRNDGPFQVAGMPYMAVVFDTLTVKGQLEIFWWLDAAATIAVGGERLVTPAAGGGAEQVIPVQAPYVTFRTSLVAYPDTIVIRINMTSTEFQQSIAGTGRNVLIQANFTNVLAGATLTLNAPATRGGRIYWRALLEGGTSARIKLFATDFAGTTYLLDYCNQDMASTGRTLYAPSYPLTVTMFNNDAGSRDAYCTVAFLPYGQ